MSYTQVSSTATSTSLDVSRRGGDDEAFQQLLEDAKANEEARRCLETRKRCELKLIRKYDKSKIHPSRDECWFMVDSTWLNKWAEFVNDVDCEDPPGPVSTKDLLTVQEVTAIDNKRVPLPNLQARIDYRAVPPLVYYIFVELYGRDSSPDICRYSVDIYKPEVPIEKLVNIKLKAVMDAKIAVNRQRPKWMNWEHKYEEEEEEDDGLACCCGLRKEHLEAFIYWAIRCWSRRSSGRANISYSKYKPLSSTQEMDQSVRLNNGSSVHAGNGEGKGGYSGWWMPSSHGANNAIADSSTHSTHSQKSSAGGSQHGDSGGLAGWWPFGNSSHGFNDDSVHSVNSTASNKEVRNAMHSGSRHGGSSHGGSSHGGSSHGRYSRGNRSNPNSSHGEDEFGDFHTSGDLEDVEVDDSSDDDDVFGIAPADQGYESGNWFRTMSGSK